MTGSSVSTGGGASVVAGAVGAQAARTMLVSTKTASKVYSNLCFIFLSSIVNKLGGFLLNEIII
jgi:hypothetical protein